MDDPHQVNTIIAGAICETLGKGSDGIGIEQAKHLGKRIVEALSDAGLTIVASENKMSSADDE